MIETELFNEEKRPSEEQKSEIIEFLYEHLEQFGDSKTDIGKAVGYALKEQSSPGGFVLISRQGEGISGAVVVNQTGMKGYIPENILVYIATHKNLRGKGIGKHLMKKSIETAQGDVALHVEPDNPARFLYEKIGFTSKYLEMRYKKAAV